MTWIISFFGTWIDDAIHRNCYVDTILPVILGGLGYLVQDGVDRTIVVGRDQGSVCCAIKSFNGEWNTVEP